MKSKDKNPFIFNYLRECIGGDYGSKLYTVTDINKGDTEVVLEYRLLKRFPIQELEQAEQEYDLLGGSGYVLDLDQLISIKKFRQFPAPKPKD